jgi:arylsulfatase
VWELYNLRVDRTQTRDVSAEHPERLEELKGLWWYYAGLYKGLPLDDRSAGEILASPRPQPGEPRNRYVYYAGAAEVPESVAVNVRRRSYTIAAGVTIDTPEAEGVIFAHGGAGGGHAIYLQSGQIHYLYN